MNDGTKALLALITAQDTYVGLLTAPGVELTAPGYARRKVAAGQWQTAQNGIVGPAVAFSGFVSTAPAVGAFLTTSADGPILFPFPFASRIKRSFLDESDMLDVTPTLALEDTTVWP